jgi:hypothetical protein
MNSRCHPHQQEIYSQKICWLNIALFCSHFFFFSSQLLRRQKFKWLRLRQKLLRMLREKRSRWRIYVGKSWQLWIIKLWKHCDLFHACKRCGRASSTMVFADLLRRFALPFSSWAEKTAEEEEDTHVEYIRKIKICTDDDTLNLASVDVNHPWIFNHENICSQRARDYFLFLTSIQKELSKLLP